MNIKEYNEQLKEINNKWNKEKLKLDKEFAFSNNPYKIGDIIKDYQSIIRIEEIQFCRAGITRNYPECIYRGTKLTKKGIPFKSGESETIYKSNISD